MLTFDVTSKESYTNLETWATELRQHIPNLQDGVSVTVCANKVDKPGRVISEGQARLWAESKGFHYHETSAYTGDGVEVRKTIYASSNPIINTFSVAVYALYSLKIVY